MSDKTPAVPPGPLLALCDEWLRLADKIEAGYPANSPRAREAALVRVLEAQLETLVRGLGQGGGND